MSRLGPNLIFGLTALLLTGAGAWLLGSRQLAAEIVAVRTTSNPELLLLRTENRERKARQRPVALPPSPVAAKAATSLPAGALDPAKRVQIVAEIYQSGLLGKSAWPNPARNSLTAGMADIADMLGLNPEETAALQVAAEKATEEFTATLARVTSVQRAGALVSLTVPNHPDLAAPNERLLASIAGVLGPERYRFYETFGGKEALAKVFDGWSGQGTTLRVFHGTAIPDEFYPPGFNPEGNQGRGEGPARVMYYYTRFQTSSAGGPTAVGVPTGGRGGNSFSGTSSIEAIGTAVGPLHKLIPPDL